MSETSMTESIERALGRIRVATRERVQLSSMPHREFMANGKNQLRYDNLGTTIEIATKSLLAYIEQEQLEALNTEAEAPRDLGTISVITR